MYTFIIWTVKESLFHGWNVLYHHIHRWSLLPPAFFCSEVSSSVPSLPLVFHLTCLMGLDSRSQPTTTKRKERVERSCTDAGVQRWKEAVGEEVFSEDRNRSIPAGSTDYRKWESGWVGRGAQYDRESQLLCLLWQSKDAEYPTLRKGCFKYARV